MLRFAKPDTARGLAPDVAAEPGRTDKDVYDRHAGSLYRQALFTLGDSGMAEQVVSDVIVEECVRPGVICCQDPERRLAVHGTSGQPGMDVPCTRAPHRRLRQLRRSRRAERQRTRRARTNDLRRWGLPARWLGSGHPSL